MARASDSKPILTLILLTSVPLLSLNMFLPSLVVMAGEFRVGYDTMSLAVSGYLAFTAVIQILAGPVADRYGRRPVLLASLALFVAASVGCAFAVSFEAFLFFRVLQGAVVTGTALSRAIVSDIAGLKQTASILGYMAMAMSLAPIIGPSIGGFLGEIAGWRANFWVFTGAGVSLWVLVLVQLPETAGESAGSGSDFVRSYRELLANLHFWAYTLIMAFSVGGFFAFISGIPFVAGEQLGLPESRIGLGMATITVGFLFGSFLSGRYSASRDLDKMIVFGRIMANLGLVGCLAVLLAGWVTPWSLFGGIVFVGFGNGLTMPGASSLVMFMRKELSASASGLSGAVVVAVGAAVTAVTGHVMEVQPRAEVLVGLILVLALASLAIAVWIAGRRPGNMVAGV